MGSSASQPGTTTRRTLLVNLRDSRDGEAWTQFETTYRSMLVRVCRSRGFQHADAEDAVQLVFTKLVTGLRRFEYDPGKGRFRDYLYRCLRSAMADMRARPKAPASAALPEDDHGPPGRSDPVAAAFDREWVDHHYRLALTAIRLEVDANALKVLEATLQGQPVRQIAESTGMTEAAVYKSQQRMRDRLKERIAEQVQEEDRLDG